MNVRDVFDYCDGVLYWRTPASNRTRANQIAGCLGNPKRGTGYVIRFNGKQYTRAQLVWAWHHGALADGVLKHIDGNKLNDRIENLLIYQKRFKTEKAWGAVKC